MIQQQTYPTYIYLHSDKFITDFQPGIDSSIDYKGNKNIYLPLDADISKFYEISQEQHHKYEKQKFQAIHPSGHYKGFPFFNK